MFKATRELIKNRQAFTKYPVVQAFNVEHKNSGKINQCFQNACNSIDRNKGVTIVSGWLIGSFDKATGSTEIIQHYWNVNRDGTFFDTTPTHTNDVEYVIDTQIMYWSQKNLNLLNSCVSSSLLYVNGKFTAVNEINGQLVFSNIKNLSVENLFLHSLSNNQIPQKLAA